MSKRLLDWRQDAGMAWWWVEDGAGNWAQQTFQVTGPLVDPTRQAESTTIGPGYSSASPIAGGRTTKLGPGEMQIIPPGVGHVWTDIAEGGIDYIVIRVDPEHVLSVSR